MSAIAITAPNATDDRQDMILAHYPLVRTIACRMVRRFPANVDVDELINVGVLGLIDAIDRFDPERSVPFKAYAEIRIRGAIVDALRESDWVPRSVRRKSHRIDAARQTLQYRLGRDPSRQEVADELEMGDREFDKLERQSVVRKLVSLDLPVDDENHTTLVERLPGAHDDAFDGIWGTQKREAVLDAIANLPEKERVAVSCYYQKGMTLKQIGEQLGVTESRACQLRGQGVKRLKLRLNRILD